MYRSKTNRNVKALTQFCFVKLTLHFCDTLFHRTRSDVIDYSIPYFHSGVSLLAAPKVKTDIPLLAFLMPFSPELWIAIFIWLNLTAIAVAIYEWLSPFGLNPWGRQRSKNFSLSSGELIIPPVRNVKIVRLYRECDPLSHQQHYGSCGDYCAAIWSHSKRPNRGQINFSSTFGAASA